MGLPDGLPLTGVLGGAGSPLVLHSTGWVRRHHVTRDAAYLWLLAERKARTVTDIAAITGTAENTVRERMRRDDAFAQVQEEGTWALTQWHQPGTTTHYPTATNTAVGALRDHGPLTSPELRAGSVTRAPVGLSAPRLQQGFSSHLAGLTADGCYDLVDRRDTPRWELEPPRPRTPQPPHITATANGTFLAVVMPVDGDLLRGGGLPIDDWVTGYLQLGTPPAQRHFRWANHPGELVIHRYCSRTTVTSLRAAVLAVGAVEGCTIALHLTTNPDRGSSTPPLPTPPLPSKRSGPRLSHPATPPPRYPRYPARGIGSRFAPALASLRVTTACSKAVSRTVLVNCFSSPPGPVRDKPCSWASLTSSRAATSSAVGSGPFFAVMSLSVVVITAPTSVSVLGRKHR